MSAEKWFSVAVEPVDGKSEVLRIAARNPGEVFRQVKERPDVRRVGKIAEGDLQPGRAERPADQTEHARPPLDRPPLDRATLMGQNLTGPRIVIDARPSGGEQPFKHLKAPPERPKPPTPTAPERPRVESAPKVPQPQAQKPAPSTQTSSVPVTGPTIPGGEVPSSDPEYRIMKTRRRDGDPYVLQRGVWQQQKGKRAFAIEWEKGFADRASAERHLQELEQAGQKIDMRRALTESM